MKLFYIISSVFISMSCSNSTQTPDSVATEANGQTNASIVAQNAGDNKWNDNFRAFVQAVTKGNSKAVKSFIDFPIKNEGNEIWYLADSKLVMDIDPDKIKPFTEADFDKYFSSIFTMDLRKTLERLELDQFFKSNTATSEEIEVVKGTKSRLEASFEPTTKKVMLVVLSKGKEFSEFAVQYEFDVTPEQKVKFRQVRVAG
ncbi:MAG: hypothetical protein JWP69_197 [Flaviaesturariibacter sp.]|nr:hypothetical protein [Flaviaesturariibacter sp.]